MSLHVRNRLVMLCSAACVAAVAAIVLSVAIPLTAQAPARAPAQAEAGAQAAASAPAGQPDLQGVWRAWNLAKYDLEDHGAMPGIPAGRGFVVDPADGKIPYLPAALAKRKENLENTKTLDPAKNADPLAKCYYPGIPRFTYLGWPFQIVQTPQKVAFYYEWGHHHRFVTLGNAPIAEDTSNWLGVSRGRYEGNSLVVTVTNFTGYTWFDMAGDFHTDALKVTEKYTPTNPDTLQYEATMEDKNVFTRPWTIRMALQRQKDVGILDYECPNMLDEMGIDHTWPRDFEVN